MKEFWLDKLFEYLWVLIFLLPLLKRVLMALFRRGEKRRGQDGHPEAEGELPGYDPAPGEQPSEARELSTVQDDLRARALGTLSDMKERLWALSSQVASLRELAAETGGAASVLRDALTRLGKEQRDLLEEIDRSTVAVEAGDYSSLGNLSARLEWESLRVHAVEHMLRVRTDPVLGERMGDADAIARELSKPLVEFGRAQGVDIPQKRVVCVPAEQGAESIWFGLLPQGYPAVFVPDDFERDLLRWPALAHEMGHLMWRDVPDFAQEVHERTGLTTAPMLIHGEEIWDVRPCYSAWLQEIFCDTVGALQLGPPALRGLVHFFSSERGMRGRVISASDGRYDPHPPPHLRVLLVAHVLRTQGFHEEVKEILGEWERVGGQVTSFALPLAYGDVTAVPADVIIAPGKQLVTALVSEQYESLAGFTLTDIPGFSLSPGIWGRVERAKEALLAGQVPNDSARVLIAAAVEAQAEQPSAVSRIARLVSEAIVGEGEKRGESKKSAPTKRAVAAPVPAAPASDPREELVEALVLRELMQRRGHTRPGWLRQHAERPRL